MDRSEAPSESKLSVVAPLPSITTLWLTSSWIENILGKFLKISPIPYNNHIRKKTFDEDRDDVPCAIGKHHAFVEASFPICMALFIMPILEWAVFIEREKELQILELGKRRSQKRPSGSRCSFYPELANWVILEKKDGTLAPSPLRMCFRHNRIPYG